MSPKKKPEPREREMPPKRARFVEEYLIDLNATQAAIRAGYSKKTAEVQGPRLLGNVRVASGIERLKAQRSAKVGITAERILEELRRLALSDVRGLFDEHGNLRAIADLTDEQAAAISSVEVVTKIIPGAKGEPADVEYVHKIRSWDKPRALELLAKHLGIIRDRMEHTGKDGAPLPQVVGLLLPDNGRGDRR